MHRHTPLHPQTHPSTKVRPADVFLRWWNVFLIFISGFGSQSWHLVTVMEQSISDKVYKGIKGREGEEVEAKWPISWGERFISLPGYGKREGGEIERGRRGGAGLTFILLQQPRAETCPRRDRSPQELPLMFTVRQPGALRGTALWLCQKRI